MTTQVADYKNSVYHREYSNDIQPQQSLSKRIAVAALPFLGLHDALRFPLSLGLGSFRVWSAEDTLNQTFAVVTLASAVFKHPAGQILTTLHDIALEVKILQKCSTREDAVKSCLKILNHLVFLALLTHGGLELSIVCLAIQAVVGLIQARDEFQKDRWIEAGAAVLMSCIRLKQLHTQCSQLKKGREALVLMKQGAHFPTNEVEAKKYAEDFIVKYGLPKNAEISFDQSTHKITVIWRGGANMGVFKEKYPKPFHKNDWLGNPVEKAKFEFSENKPIRLETVYFGQTSWGHDYHNPNFLVQQGTVTPENDLLAIRVTKDFEVADFPENFKLYGW